MSGPAHRVQSAMEEFGYPQGHLGHLNAEQEAAFKNFKALCAEKGYYQPGNGADIEPSHDDPTLLRFLRARRFSVMEAWKQFQDTEDWRKRTQLDKLYETIDLEQYEETRRLYPQWTGRRDRRGIPVYVFEVQHLNSKTMSAYEKSAKDTKSKATQDGQSNPKLMRLFALYENLIRFVMPLCTALSDREHPRTPITQSNNIVDISGVGLKQFWNLRGHMQDASTLATAHYPETLDRIFIIGAPAFFPTVWGWIKKWFDPITTSKIFILSHHDMKKTLEEFIDPINIPKKYGGELPFKFGDMPLLDPALSDVLTWEDGNKDFPDGPMYWIPKDSGRSIQAIAKGSIDEKERNETVCTVRKTIFDDPTSLTATAPLANGHATEPTKNESQSLPVPPPAPAPESILLTAPTVPPSPAASSANLTAVPTTEPVTTSNTAEQKAAEAAEEKVVQNGLVIPASRPELTSFHTAHEGVANLALDEKANGTAEIKGPHQSALANALDPAVNGGKEGTTA